MKQLKAIILYLLLLVPGSIFAQEIRIRSIYVRTQDIFDGDQFDAWYYQLANRLHMKTQASFVRNELLFRSGDLLNEDLLKESERNLRRYGFLTSAHIDAVPVNPDEADVYVTTEDQWTLNIYLSYKQSRGAQTYDLGFAENNFLGLGKKVEFKSERNEERETLRGSYFDPRLFGSRFQFSAGLSDTTDGHHNAASFALPFFAETSRWSFAVGMDDLRKDDFLYFNGKKTARQQLNSNASSFTLQHAWGERYHKTYAGIYTDYQEAIYPEPPVILNPEFASEEVIVNNLNPPDRRFYEYGITAGINFQNYTTRTYLDYYGVTEDIPYGPLFNVSLLKTMNHEGSDYVHVVTSGRIAYAPSDSIYAMIGTEAGIRRQSGEWNNMFLNFQARGYLQTGPHSMLAFQSPRQTLAGSVSATITNQIDPPFQLSLGDDDGLRGYRFKSFLGTNRVLLNLEDRIFTNFENKLLGIAVVPFLDAGAVWGGGTPWTGGVSTGIGLRVGIKKFKRSHTLRIDFAWPMINSIDRGISISFASGQVFNALP